MVSMRFPKQSSQMFAQSLVIWGLGFGPRLEVLGFELRFRG